mgnify:CR=1 FL=1|jgi:hypothetical protein
MEKTEQQRIFQSKGLKGSVFEDNVANYKYKLQDMMTHHMNLLTTITE